MFNAHVVSKSVTIAILFNLSHHLSASPFVTSVVDYQPGIGYAVEFGSGLGYTNTLAVLEEPSRNTSGPFGGPVNPFSPPFLAEQLLSIGEGGSVILEFELPVFNHPNNPYGLDFILFGNAGFNITNGDYSGGGITDGSVFGNDQAKTSIWVSQDNVAYYQLDPFKSPPMDVYFPTDGQGDFRVPVNPLHQPSDFTNAGLTEIRSNYNGSGGGAGYDLAWALGAPDLDRVRFVKIMVHAGKVELDGAAIVAPVSKGNWSSIHEDFSADPFESGAWEIFGDSGLFSWEPTRERIAATWDSRQPNSYFYLPIGNSLSREEDFSIQFEIQLDHLELGINPDKPFTFPLAVGLVNLESVTRDQFFRGSGIHEEFGPRGLVEWSYHPDSGFGATISSGLISLDNQWALSNTFPLELQLGKTFAVAMKFNAESKTLRTVMTEDGAPFGPIREAKLSNFFGGPDSEFTDIDVDAFAIASYNDGGQPSPEFAGSIYATGWVDNVALTREQSLRIQNLRISDDCILVGIEARAGWEYWLEQTSDFVHWETRGLRRAETNERLLIEDQGAGQFNGFYRVIGHPQ